MSGAESPAPRPSQPQGSLPETYRQLFDRHPNPLWVADLATLQILAVNDAAAELHGYTRDEMLAMSIADLRPPQEKARFTEASSHRFAGAPHRGLYRHARKNGSLIDVEVRAASIEWDGKPARLIAAIDLSDRVRAEERLRISERLLEQAGKVANIGSYEIDLTTGAVIWSDEVYRILGVSPGTFVPGRRSFYEFDHPEDAETIRRMVDMAVRTKTELRLDHRICRPDGQIRWVHEHSEYLVDDRGNITKAFGILQDVTDRKSAEDASLRDAHYDQVSGLPNQVLFRKKLAELVERARAEGQYLVLVLLDLDRFTAANEVFGLAACDELIREIARRLAAECPDSELLARTSGDEFELVFRQTPATADPDNVAEQALKVFERPFDIGSVTIHQRASAGVSVYPLDSHNDTELVRHAHIAKNRARGLGGNVMSRFVAAMKADLIGRSTLESDLRTALEDEQFEVFYQPMVSGSDGAVAGAEALVRWHHPDRGLVAPLDFIPVAEETGLIVQIGEFVLREACAQAQAWRSADRPGFRISVNVSARQMRERRFAAAVQHALERTGLPPANLELEITESLLMEQGDICAHAFSVLKRMGVRISLDDFGTGYTSFDYIHRFGIDTLKIDRSFIRGVIDNAQKHAVTRAIMALAEDLDLNSVAEGVETKAQYYVLRQWGIKLLQGFYFSPPVAAKKFEALMGDGRIPH